MRNYLLYPALVKCREQVALACLLTAALDTEGDSPPEYSEKTANEPPSLRQRHMYQSQQVDVVEYIVDDRRVLSQEQRPCMWQHRSM